MTPFYGRLPNVAGFDVGGWVDTVGLSLAGIAAAAVVAHGVMPRPCGIAHGPDSSVEDEEEA